MSRFKTCEMESCRGKLSRSNPHIVKLVSIDEGLGRFYGHAPKCSCCKHTDEMTIKMKPIKLKVCNYCYQDFKDGHIYGLHISGIDRKLDSFDPVKNIAYYTKATEEQRQGQDINPIEA